MKGLLILSNNLEDTEALSTRALLRRAQIEVDTVTINKNKQVVSAYGLTLMADYHVLDIKLSDYQFLIIPGGKYVAEIIESDTFIHETAASFLKSDKLLCAICAGPRFLGEIGALKNHHYTIYPGNENTSFGGFYEPSKKAITDGKIITARGAGATLEFASEIIRYIKGEEVLKAILKAIAY